MGNTVLMYFLTCEDSPASSKNLDLRTFHPVLFSFESSIKPQRLFSKSILHASPKASITTHSFTYKDDRECYAISFGFIVFSNFLPIELRC